MYKDTYHGPTEITVMFIKDLKEDLINIDHSWRSVNKIFDSEAESLEEGYTQMYRYKGCWGAFRQAFYKIAEDIAKNGAKYKENKSKELEALSQIIDEYMKTDKVLNDSDKTKRDAYINYRDPKEGLEVSSDNYTEYKKT